MLRSVGSALLIALIATTVALAQTETPTRRPTPRPTGTPTTSGTPTITGTPTDTPQATTTPTRFPTDAIVDVCSGGDNDGAECSADDECSPGACVTAVGICDEATSPVFCTSDPAPECGGGRCLLTQKVCAVGDLKGVACLRDSQCGGALCVSTGQFCYGGDFDNEACVDTDDCCAEIPEGGTCDSPCISPDVFLCSSGENDGLACDTHTDCITGACVLANKICDGGSNDSFDCDNDGDCAAPCVPTQKICASGDYKGFGCLRDEQCPSGVCVSSGLYCDGGVWDDPNDIEAPDFPLSCVDNGDCQPAPGCSPSDPNCYFDPGTCEPPVGQKLVCSAGSKNGQDCANDDDCLPGGVCVLTQTICNGGPKDSFPCNSSADCLGGLCQNAWAVCDGGPFPGDACFNDAQCGDQSVGGNCIGAGGQRPCCFYSGRFCDEGVFADLPCLDDASCNCDEEDTECFGFEVEPGACVGLTERDCTIAQPCVILGEFSEQVFAPADLALSPASVDFYLAPIPVGAVAAVITLRLQPNSIEFGDADLYVGREPSEDTDDYAFRSEEEGTSTDVVRIDALSDPPFAEFVDGLTDIALTAVAFEGGPRYVIDPLFLGTSSSGDANCDTSVDGVDLDGIENVLFDPAARLTPANQGESFGRCVGTDANGDGAETAADLVATLLSLD